jgi:hypothetical protein
MKCLGMLLIACLLTFSCQREPKSKPGVLHVYLPPYTIAGQMGLMVDNCAGGAVEITPYDDHLIDDSHWFYMSDKARVLFIFNGTDWRSVRIPCGDIRGKANGRH